MSKVPEGADTFQLPAIEWQTTPNLVAHNYKSTDFFYCVRVCVNLQFGQGLLGTAGHCSLGRRWG